MASTPYMRVHHLIGTPKHQIPFWQSYRWNHKPVTSTPATLTGNPSELYSYAMRIAWKDGSDWLVVDTRVSATTNRHLSAVHNAIAGSGYLMVGTETHYAGRFGEPVPVIRYRATR
jgi:hypothetical protein